MHNTAQHRVLLFPHANVDVHGRHVVIDYAVWTKGSCLAEDSKRTSAAKPVLAGAPFAGIASFAKRPFRSEDPGTVQMDVNRVPTEQYKVHEIVGDGRCMFRATVRICSLARPSTQAQLPAASVPCMPTASTQIMMADTVTLADLARDGCTGL